MKRGDAVDTLNQMRPWMTDVQCRHVETLLLELADSRPGPLEVFEWGSGGSTYHFSMILRTANMPFRWTSVEYNRKWYEKVCEAVRDIDEVQVKLYAVNNDRLKQRRTDMDAYVNSARAMRREFDFILVDGRKRRRCLIHASKLLRPGGRVALHDASREYYHCAFDRFEISHFVDPDLWIGGQGDDVGP